jgi:hypothetical protein
LSIATVPADDRIFGFLTMNAQKVPPPAIGSDRVIAYAFVDKTVAFTGKKRLYVDGELLGPVPRIAICKSLNKDVRDYLILYCDKNWNVRGISGAPSFARAVKEAERCYQGISAKFIRVNTSAKAAREWLADKYPHAVCSFCGRMFFEVSTMIEAKSAVICSVCVEDFARELNLAGCRAPLDHKHV